MDFRLIESSVKVVEKQKVFYPEFFCTKVAQNIGRIFSLQQKKKRFALESDWKISSKYCWI